MEPDRTLPAGCDGAGRTRVSGSRTGGSRAGGCGSRLPRQFPHPRPSLRLRSQPVSEYFSSQSVPPPLRVSSVASVSTERLPGPPHCGQARVVTARALVPVLERPLPGSALLPLCCPPGPARALSPGCGSHLRPGPAAGRLVPHSPGWQQGPPRRAGGGTGTVASE